MLDEVDLVDVALRDRVLYRLDRADITLVGPAAFPFADRVASGRPGRLVRRANLQRREGQATGLRQGRRAAAAKALGQPVADVEVGHQPVRPAFEEAGCAKAPLDLGERAQLKHVSTLTCRACAGLPGSGYSLSCSRPRQGLPLWSSPPRRFLPQSG